MQNDVHSGKPEWWVRGEVPCAAIWKTSSSCRGITISRFSERCEIAYVAARYSAKVIQLAPVWTLASAGSTESHSARSGATDTYVTIVLLTAPVTDVRMELIKAKPEFESDPRNHKRIHPARPAKQSIVFSTMPNVSTGFKLQHNLLANDDVLSTISWMTAGGPKLVELRLSSSALEFSAHGRRRSDVVHGTTPESMLRLWHYDRVEISENVGVWITYSSSCY
ncbi:hypothetical protein BS47DRAFT_844255 [Hydnum rufescens UP504]|uniref:Uncharacterized protein n=1 Tax=Hydnum rufescens UP504 TaxID=1448309 RepID=A0A9P6ACI6_9AGAM|nr:hypothetical protein BS47DRAFT_844255 [Hydnum rufescens UP504]